LIYRCRAPLLSITITGCFVRLTQIWKCGNWAVDGYVDDEVIDLKHGKWIV
jgi:hypothetical protein